MKAVLTFDNDNKCVVDIVLPFIISESKRRIMRFHDEFEREFVNSWNLSRPHAQHKVVKAHILRN